LHSFPVTVKSVQCLAPFTHLRESPEESVKSTAKTVISMHNHVDFERMYLGRFTSPSHAKCHWYINEFVDGLLKTDDTVLLKGIYKMFSSMAEKHTTFPLPMSFVLPVILDQIEALSIGTDIDTQYDILVLLTHVVGQLSKELARYAHRIFLHFVRIAYLVTAVIKKQPKATYIELKPGTVEGTLQTIQGHPQYLKLWDRLSDTYRIGRSTFGDENTFEAVQRATFQGLSQCVTKIGRQFMMPFIAELLTYISANFDDQPLAVVESLRVLFVATFNLGGTTPFSPFLTPPDSIKAIQPRFLPMLFLRLQNLRSEVHYRCDNHNLRTPKTKNKTNNLPKYTKICWFRHKNIRSLFRKIPPEQRIGPREVGPTLSPMLLPVKLRSL